MIISEQIESDLIDHNRDACMHHNLAEKLIKIRNLRKYLNICVCVCVYIYIYIFEVDDWYMYRSRSRNRGKS